MITISIDASARAAAAAVLLLLLAGGCSACNGGGSDQPDGGGPAGAGVGGKGGAGGGAGGSGASSSGGKGGAGGTGGANGGAGGTTDGGDGWELAWSPMGCQTFRAKDLSVVPPLVWKDCGNGVAGCVYLDTSPLAGAANKNGDKISDWLGVTRRGGSTFFTIDAKYSTFLAGPVIYELGAGPRAAWRNDATTGECGGWGAVFGADNGVALFNPLAVGGTTTTVVVYNKTETWNLDSSSILTIDSSVTGNSLEGVVRMQFSSQVMALEMIPNSLVYTWDYSSAKPKVIPRPADVAEDYQPSVKGSEVVFQRDSPTATARAFAVRHPDGSVENLYQKPSVWAIDLRSDGTDMVWQELNQTTKVLELWTSPWATTPAAFTPKKVRTIDGAQNLVSARFAGEKWWVYRKDDATLRAVRLSDGNWLDVPAPSGFGWVTPFGVVNGELWATIFVSPGSNTTTYSVARVPIASLGTPQQ